MRSLRTRRRRDTEPTLPPPFATGRRPFPVQRDEQAGPSAPARGDAAGVLDSYLDQRRIARAVSPGEGAVQRYTVVTPDHIGTEKNAQVTTQDIAQTRYGSAYRETTYTARATGTNPNATRTDTAVNANTMTSQASGLPSFRVSESGELAVPDGEAQPRNFYAQAETVNEANDVFRDAGATARLTTEGHGVVVPTDPQNPDTSGTRRLKRVHAAEEVPTGVDGGVRLQIAAALPAMDCNNFVTLVMGASANASRVAVLQKAGTGQETEVQAPTGGEPIEQMARHMTRSKPADPPKMGRLLEEDALQAPDLVAGKTAYEQMSDSSRTARAARLGINESASPEVGEGFVIRSMDNVELRAHPAPLPAQQNPGLLSRADRKQMRNSYLQILAQLDQAQAHLQAGRHGLPARVQRMMRTWGEHYAGVVAKDGPDVVTLENYNRRTEIRWEHERIFNNLFRDFEQFRLLVSQNVASLYQAPDEGTIRNMVQLARQAGNLPLAYQAALNEAQQSFQQGLQLTGRTGGGNFFFQMYGPGDQSFHSAYKDVASNAMTLHIREDPAAVREETAGSLRSLNTLLIALDTGTAAQAVPGVNGTLRTTVQQARTRHRQLRTRLKTATTRGEYSRIDEESLDVRTNLRTAFRGNLIDAYETLTGVQLAQRPTDLQGLNTLVTNYLATHQGTGLFGGLYAYATGWRQRLLDFQTLLAAFNGLPL